jgi:2'-5' RNA ligase
MAGTDDRHGKPGRTERPERVRAFIALTPPPATIESIADWQRRAVDGRRGLRAIGADALHLTLAFLGDREEEEIERIRGALRAAVEPVPVPVRLEAEPIGLPRRRPRVVAFAATSPVAVSLHEALVARLAAAGLTAPDGRPFRPHLSVARVRGDPDRRRAREVLAGLPALTERSGHTFDAVRVALYRSQLRSQGARYSVLADVDLPRSGG